MVAMETVRLAAPSCRQPGLMSRLCRRFTCNAASRSCVAWADDYADAVGRRR